MADITIVTGVYKPTYNWGAPSCGGCQCLPLVIQHSYGQWPSCRIWLNLIEYACFFVEHGEYGDFMVIFNQLEFDELWDYVGSHQFGQSLHLSKVPGGVSSLSHLKCNW